MFDYKKYDIKDFICDHSFQRWVVFGLEVDRNFWQSWVAQNPDKKELVEEAAETLSAIVSNYDHIVFTELDKQKVIDRVMQHVDEREAEDNLVPFYKTVWFMAAASVVVAMGLGLLSYFIKFSAGQGSNNEGVASSGVKIESFVNTTDKPQLVTLSDGSSVLLKRNTTIEFKFSAGSAKREAVLSGEAFFEVAKDKSAPFFVYAQGLTTRVTGTSFTIRAYKSDKKVKVMVKSGSVLVYSTQNEGKTNKLEAPENAITLSPNEEAQFVGSKSPIDISDVKNDELTEFAIQKEWFDFNKTPVSKVIEILEQSYGIDIVAAGADLNNRTITASLGDKPFLKKIEIICALVDAGYEVKGDKLIITSYGN